MNLFLQRTADYNGEVDIEDWWVTDFTLEELLELRLVQQFEFRDQSFNNLYTIPTFEEYCQLALGWFYMRPVMYSRDIKVNDPS